MNLPQQTQAPVAPPAAPAPAAPSDDEGGGTFEENLARMQEEIRRENGAFVDENAGQTPAADGAPVAAPAAPADAQAAQPPSTPEQRNADRQARLAKLRAEEQARVDAIARRSQGAELARALEAERQARAAAEARAQGLVDPSALDEARFLELAERAQVDPNKLAAFIQQRMTNPERFAAEAAARAVDPKLTAQERRIAELEQQLASFVTEQRQREAQAEAQRATQDFLASVAKTDGLAAKFLTAEGPAKFMRIVERAAERLPDHAGPEALMDQIEEILETDGRALYQQLTAIYGPPGAVTPSNATTPPKPAAAKAPTTVTNSIAQERASVVTDADPTAGMSYWEKVEYLKRHV